MTAPRDAHRSRVYRAEAAVRAMLDRADATGDRTVEVAGSTVTLPVERRFGSLESLREYVDRVRTRNRVRARHPRAESAVAVRARAGHTAAHYDSATATIAVPPPRAGDAWAMRELVALHELAHHLSYDPRDAPHGPAFVDCYLTLVGEEIGPEAAFVLRACGVH